MAYNLVLFIFGNYLQPSYLVIVPSIICGLLPDLIDVVYSSIKRFVIKQNKVDFRHHSWPTHFPFMYIPFIVLIFIFPSVLTISMAINIYLHFLGDTFYSDDGIRWLWPFMKHRSFKLLSKSMVGKHDKEWLIAYRKTPLFKFEWVLFILTSVIITINAYLLYNIIIFFLVMAIMVSLMIFFYYFEKSLEKNLLRKFFKKDK
ncbi:MAG: metal-dependent hydrolase [Candidatus Helarchaeota archaeon]